MQNFGHNFSINSKKKMLQKIYLKYYFFLLYTIMKILGQKLCYNFEYQDLILFMENVVLNKNFKQISTQKFGEVYYE
jgi:hypothetical protein